jgi:hypothetical protein
MVQAPIIANRAASLSNSVIGTFSRMLCAEAAKKRQQRITRLQQMPDDLDYVDPLLRRCIVRRSVIGGLNRTGIVKVTKSERIFR